MIKNQKWWAVIGSLLVLYAVYTQYKNSSKNSGSLKDQAPLDLSTDNLTDDLTAESSEKVDLRARPEITHNQEHPPQEQIQDLKKADQPKLGVTPSNDAASKKPLGKNELRYRLHGSYVLAGEDILLGEIKPGDQEKWSSSGRLLWNRGVEIWPGGVVPIALHSSLPDALTMNIKEAVSRFHQQTSIRFVEFQDEKDAVLFVYDAEVCASHVGRVGGHQPILLSDRCGVKEIMHELMHTLGFIHEHQRENRDTFVNVHLDQVQEDKMINFDILPSAYQEIYRRLSIAFDPKSITMYPPHAFSKTEQGVTISNKNSVPAIQPSHSLSGGDLIKIKEVYERGF